jgi:cell division protein FtsB
MSTRAAATPQAAARGTTPPAEPVATETASVGGSGAADRPRRARLSARGALLLVVVILLLVAAVNPVRSLLDERGRLADLRRQTVELQTRNDVLQHQVDRLNDPAYLERLARQCLGMVKPGEIAFVMVPKHGAPVPPDC